jgi:glycosyltransferase involved in cell wall biosynthesis
MPKVLLLPKYGKLAATTRYRLEQYLPALRKAGVKVTVQAAFSDRYLEAKIGSGKTRFLAVIRGFLGRVGAVLGARSFDAAIVFSEGYPYIPPIFELSLRWLGVPYIYDFDDAEFHRYDTHRSPWVRALLGRKVALAIGGASHVFAGNAYLAKYAARTNPSVTILPTVVDLERYSRIKNDFGNIGAIRVGWIGSPSTSVYLKTIAPALAEFTRESASHVVAVGAGSLELPGVNLQIKKWSEAEELDELLAFDAGLMPLSDDPWARGKCGFKLIQYMACGIPVIASPVGVNAEIVSHGVDGFLATTQTEWSNALRRLARDPALRERMGKAGREKVRAKYSLQVTRDVFVSELLKVAALRVTRQRID